MLVYGKMFDPNGDILIDRLPLSHKDQQIEVPAQGLIG
jgi:hypothetical protein